MTLTNPDQYAKIAQQETNTPMFPRGPKQMLGFIYAMENEIARKMSFHAKLIDIRGQMDEGYIQPFSTHSINLSGLAPVDINGECAGLRQQVEELLGVTDELHVVLAKFGKDELERTEQACDSLAWGLRDHLMRGQRKSQRGKPYCKDLVRNITCSAAVYDKHFSVTKLSRRHHISQPMVSRDCIETKRYITAILSRAYNEIEKKFSDGVVLPLTE